MNQTKRRRLLWLMLFSTVLLLVVVLLALPYPLNASAGIAVCGPLCVAAIGLREAYRQR